MFSFVIYSFLFDYLLTKTVNYVIVLTVNLSKVKNYFIFNIKVFGVNIIKIKLLE